MKRFAIALLCVFLYACGGGGSDEEESVTVQPVNCQQNPEACK